MALRMCCSYSVSLTLLLVMRCSLIFSVVVVFRRTHVLLWRWLNCVAAMEEETVVAFWDNFASFRSTTVWSKTTKGKTCWTGKVWVHPVFQPEAWWAYCQYHNLVRELSLGDREYYFRQTQNNLPHLTWALVWPNQTIDQQHNVFSSKNERVISCLQMVCNQSPETQITIGKQTNAGGQTKGLLRGVLILFNQQWHNVQPPTVLKFLPWDMMIN